MEEPGRLATRVEGRRWDLFRLAFSTSLMTVATLGLYRFWMKTRLRRWIWSSLRPGGHPLEYSGQPAEKLAGFLIAVMVLAFYLGVVNLALVFASYSLLAEGVAAYVLSFAGLVPMWFFAQYRARRYLLARTRWRGIRFAAEPAALAYAFRALLHWCVTLLSLGVLWPRMTFALEKFRTDRTWFGTARFRQDGRWTMLLPAMRHIYVALALGAGVAALAYWAHPAWGAAVIVPLGWFGVGVVHYRVQSFRILTGHKRLETIPGEAAPEIALRASPRTRRVVGIYSLGGVAMGVVMSACLVVFFAALGAATDFLGMASETPLEGLGTRATIAVAVASYFIFFISWGVLGQVFVSFPILRHLAETLELIGGHRFAAVRQRERDAGADAEGFADALDVGAAL